MKKSSLALAAIVMVVGANAQSPAGLRKLFEGKARAFVQAFESKNLKWFASTSTDDLTVIANGRASKKAEAISQLKQLFTMARSLKVTETVTDVKLVGKNVLVTSKSHMVGSVAGPGGKISKIVDTSVSKELWVPGGADYKLKRSEVISESISLDGKAVKSGM